MMQPMPMRPSPHIMLVDDHPIVRRGVRHILTDAFPGAQIEEVGFGADAILLLLGGMRWDMVILDLTLPDGSGMEVLERIRELDARLPVLILSMHPADEFAHRALGAGASGFVTKEAADTELVVAVRQVVGGKTYVSRGPGRSFGDPDAERPHERLSGRERQVMVEIAQGKTTTEIARDLKVGVKTVSTYRARLLRKMDMRSNAEISRYVREHLPGEPRRPG
jgi:DNA-binding NarL/FixJ family response regulator